MTRTPQKYANLKEELIRMWQLKTTCIMPPVLSTAGIALNKLHDSLKLLTLLSAPYVTMQEAAILHTHRIVESFWQNIE